MERQRVERNDSRWVLAGVVGLYLVVTIGQSWLKLLWGDELITFYVAQQGSIHAIWTALRSGADPNPPLMHVAVRVAVRLFGPSSVAIRLPSILLGLVAVVSLWIILRCSITAWFAGVGVITYMATRGFDYSYDARSYSGLLGFSMVSLACWLKAQEFDGSRRWLLLGGMTLALAGGMSSNYYGVLAFFPIAVGEVTLSLDRRRVRLDVWASLLLASLPLLVYLPLIRHNIAEFAPHAWNRPKLSIIGMSYLELVEGILWPVLGLAVYAWFRRREVGWGVPRYEIAAMSVLLVYPFLGFAVAVGGAGMISPRCVVPVCCGVGLAAGVLAQAVFAGGRRAGQTIMALLVVWIVVRQGVCAGLMLEQRRSFLALRDEAASFRVNEIVVADSSFVLPLAFYSSRQVRRRIFVPIDFPAIQRVEKDDSGEENLWGGRNGVFPFQVAGMDGLRLDRPFLLIGRPDGWLAQALEAKGFSFGVEGDSADWGKVGGVFTPMAHPETRFLVSK